MTQELFISDMCSTYKSKDNEDLNTAFYAQISTFAGKCKEINLEEVNDYIVRKHSYSTPFKLSLAYKFAEKKGFMVEVDKQVKKRKPVWWTCKQCGVNYSKSAKACPECKNIYASISTGDLLPDNFVDVKEDCSYCNIYLEIERNENWNTAIDCEQYGRKQDASCQFCQCKECCRQMMMYSADHAGTIEKYKSGELAQPWLTDVKPLNETVKEMVDKMKKGVDVINIMR